MVLPHLLRVEFDRCAPHHRVPELPNHSPVDPVAKTFNSTEISRNDNRSLIIRIFPLRLGVNSEQIQIIPHPVDQFVQIPPQMSSDRHIVINLVKNVQLLKSNRIDFVESVQAGDVLSVAFNYIDNIVFSCVAFYEDIRVADSVLFQYSLDGIVADFISIDHSGDGHPSLVLSLEIDVRRYFVQSDSKTLQLVLNDFFVVHGSSCIQHYDN